MAYPSASDHRSVAPLPDEVRKFSALAARWWDPDGELRPLHRINPVRLGFMREAACAHFGLDPARARPLEGLRVLDIGCGGGLVSEPMARMGAEVIGIDAAEACVEVARAHARGAGVAVRYRVGGPEALVGGGELFDVVLALEIVEHVGDVAAFLGVCGELVRGGGMVFVSTLNRTARSFLLGIVAAEYVLGWAPRGTHRWERFVRPEELAGVFGGMGFGVWGSAGMVYDPLRDEWGLSGSLAVNYIMGAVRGAGGAA